MAKRRNGSSATNTRYHQLDSCLDDSYNPELCALSDLIKGKGLKKPKTQHLRLFAYVRFNTHATKPKPVTMKVLLDSGASDCVVNPKFTTKLKRAAKSSGTVFTTPGGKMKTTSLVEAQFTLPELHDDKLIKWKWHVTSNLGNYDAIIGRDLLQFLGIDMCFSDQTIQWQELSMPFKDADSPEVETYHIDESKSVTDGRI